MEQRRNRLSCAFLGIKRLSDSLPGSFLTSVFRLGKTLLLFSSFSSPFRPRYLCCFCSSPLFRPRGRSNTDKEGRREGEKLYGSSSSSSSFPQISRAEKREKEKAMFKKTRSVAPLQNLDRKFFFFLSPPFWYRVRACLRNFAGLTISASLLIFSSSPSFLLWPLAKWTLHPSLSPIFRKRKK